MIGVLCGAAIISVSYLFLFPMYVEAKRKVMEAETKSNVHLIQIALECYWVDHCVFPADIDTLITDGYLEALPMNIFTKQPMKGISFGAFPYEGEFTYVPYTIDNNIRAYYLIAYGKNGGNGQDLDRDGIDDHAIMVAENGIDMQCGAIPRLDEVQALPLEDLLKAQKENPQPQSIVEPENIQ
jgi:competence protein ComGC